MGLQSGRSHSLKARYNRARLKLKYAEPEPKQTCEFCDELAYRLTMSKNGWLICEDCSEKEG